MSRFVGLIAAAVLVAALIAPANAAAVYFTIQNPPDGSVIRTVPDVPDLFFFDEWMPSGVLTCDYDGTPTLDSDPGGPCTVGGHQRPTVSGDYTLLVSGDVTDGVGTLADYDTVAFTLDKIYPEVEITPLPGNWTNVKRPTFSFTATDEHLDSVECQIYGIGSLVPCNGTFTPGVDLEDSLTSYTFWVYATDEAGNVTAGTYNFFVDTTPPILNVIYPTPGVTVDSSVPEVNLAVDGATAGAFCRFDDQPYQPCASTWTGGSLADGAHTLSVRAVDLAGNETLVVVPFFVDDALGATPVPFETSVTGRSGKVRRGKFKVKAGFSLLGPEGADAAILCNTRVRVSLKPKGGRTVTKRVKLRRSGARCRVSTTFTLRKRFKGKRAKLTFRYPGTAALGVVSRSKTIRKL